MSVFEVSAGSSPVVLGLPHTGILIPDHIWDRLNDNGKLLADTDWHIERLYDGLLPHATTVRATFHRYVIDANRDPEGGSLYPGQNTTDLIPSTDFDGNAIWKAGQEPDDTDIAARLDEFHAPYHRALLAELERVKAINGVAILYDCHSIRSKIPFLFEGTLPDFNVGTVDGTSCSPMIENEAVRRTAEAQGYSSVLNGRFRGGWTTRRYGRPEQGLHAIQMELAQATHLVSELPPFAYDEYEAAKLRGVLKDILEGLERLAPQLAQKSEVTK